MKTPSCRHPQARGVRGTTRRVGERQCDNDHPGKRRRRPHALTVGAAVWLLAGTAIGQAEQWSAVTGSETLREFMSGLTAERTLPNGEVSHAEYHADGTGTVYAWGATLPRTWAIEDEDRLCISEERDAKCYSIEHNTADPDLYRVREVKTGTLTEFRVTDGRSIALSAPEDVGSKGGAATASADELAAELSNPNSAVATLTFKNQFRWFEGDLRDADNQSSYTLLFQPSLPFVLPSGDKILWRPAVPLLVDQPVFDPVSGESHNLSLCASAGRACARATCMT